jgi:transposase, IS5 family
MGQNHLAHVAGGAINAVLAAASYNFRRLLVWLMLLRACFLHAVLGARSSNCRLIAS